MSLDRALIIGKVPEPSKVEVCRSFAYKLNLQHYGGNQYESADFFASRKMECSTEDAEWMSQQIFEECVSEVQKSIKGFIGEMRRKKAAGRSEVA